jgi:nucleoside-diphosphate-sugar epimerase
MKKILICGATGFIGRNLVEHYSSKGHEIIAVWHKRAPFECKGVRWIQADLRTPGVLDQVLKDVDVVIQAAATTSGSKDIVNTPSLHVTDNAVMNSLLFRSFQEKSVPQVVFFSCSVMYPSSNKPSREEDFSPEKIHSKYFGVGWTKVYLENMARFYSTLGKTRFTVLRHSNIYGPWDKFDLEKGHVFSATMVKVDRSENELVVWGSGEEQRDLLHVSDLMSFIDISIEHQKENFGLYNVGSGIGIRVKDIVKSIVSESGKKLDIQHDLSRPTIPVDIVLDCAKARALGWKPEITLKEGIQRTWAWYQKNKN